MLASAGLPPLHLAAIDPNDDVVGQLAGAGFDSVTHYVPLARAGRALPAGLDEERAALRAPASGRWWQRARSFPYHPSVAPGWDASPRGADFGDSRPDRYPWSPVITGEHPDRFQAAVARAAAYVRASGLSAEQQLVFVASLNEWSEGHYLEPDTRFGLAWIEAVRAGRG